jgi:hypothetical protein
VDDGEVEGLKEIGDISKLMYGIPVDINMSCAEL